MWSDTAFGEILDEKLNVDVRRVQAQSVADSFYVRPSAPPVAGSAPPSFAFRDVAPATARSAYLHVPPDPAAGSRPARPARPLTSDQRAALQCLQNAGAAALDETFSDADLRTAFRMLARRFHPDCHPGASESERRGLARTFVRITDAYRALAVLMAN